MHWNVKRVRAALVPCFNGRVDFLRCSIDLLSDVSQAIPICFVFDESLSWENEQLAPCFASKTETHSSHKTSGAGGATLGRLRSTERL